MPVTSNLPIRRPTAIDNETITSGFVTVTGRPNVGKSTLVNRLVGERVSITTSTPRTTRYLTRGILNRSDAQIVLTDTPALHDPSGPLEDQLVRRTREAWKDGDMILLIVDAERGLTDEDRQLLGDLGTFEQTIVLAANAVDRLPGDPTKLVDRLDDAGPWVSVIPTSAKTGSGTDKLVHEIEKHLPEGPRFFPPDQLTDRGRGFRVSERIREQAINRTHEEVPHSLAVITDFIGPGEDPEITVVEATILVERDSQKGILIGKGGETIKAIGQEARPKLEKLLEGKVYLDLSVELLENWTEIPDKIENVRELKGQIHY